RWLAALGFFTFFFSTTFQFVGLAGTTATANVLIVAIEPLIVVLMAWFFLREKIGASDTLAFFISVLGFCLLSNLNPGDVAGSASLFNIGNLILLFTMFTDTAYSVVSRKLRGRVAPFSVFACSLPFGFTMITLYVFFTGKGFPSFPSMTMREWLALLWLGPLGTTITYAYWSVALASVPVSAVALTLFAQPILGTVAGILFLGEHLNPLQWAGAALMLAALGMQTSMEMRKSEA
ncbi:MAG TPA: DMT family transporter, partial [Bdellovibrionota bacterium]